MNWQKIFGPEKVKTGVLDGQKILQVPSNVFEKLAEISFEEMRYFFRESHLEHWHEILQSPESSNSEKEKMRRNLQAAVESARKKVPYCQDCGTDSVYLFRGGSTVVEGDIFDAIQSGATTARMGNPFRNSVFVPTPPPFGHLPFQKGEERLEEENSGDNSPAEIHFFESEKAEEVSGVFANKGGGSGSKLWQFSVTPGLGGNREKLKSFLIEKIAEIGHSACPPYELSISLGGLSALQNMEILTRSTVGDDSFLPPFLKGGRRGVVREESLESSLTKNLKSSNMGAQGEGKFFVMPDGVRVYRAPRHAAHYFISIGVACSAHRVQKFKINEEGVFLETLCKNPGKFLKDTPPRPSLKKREIEIDFEGERDEILNQLKKISAGEEFLISGPILGARDKAHARWLENFEKTGEIPDYLRQYLGVFYVGPSDTPEGDIIGSFGPTTAGRMDEFSKFLLSNNLIPLSIAKGSRSKSFAENCGKFGGMFAAIQGGPASLLRNFITAQEVIDFEDLGMEAVRVYTVEKMPVQLVVDATGQDLYRELANGFLQGQPHS